MARKAKIQSIYRLTITLLYVDPKVVRRLDVPVGMRLDDLHIFIQAAMGWHDCHLWGFHTSRYGERRYWSPDEYGDEVRETIDDVLSSLRGKREFEYLYDYGDNWSHRVRVGKAQRARVDRTYPYLVGGTGKCPLEDIGGVWGYAEFLNAFDDPDSEYREYYPEFFENGEPYDPEDAELEKRINRVERLKMRYG